MTDKIQILRMSFTLDSDGPTGPRLARLRRAPASPPKQLAKGANCEIIPRGGCEIVQQAQAPQLGTEAQARFAAGVLGHVAGVLAHVSGYLNIDTE